MRCHFIIEKDEDSRNSVPNGMNIWSTAAIPTPNVVKTIDHPNGTDGECCTGQLPDLCSLDAVSVPHKRKILECEKEDFQERLQKIQRKIQLHRVNEQENMIVDVEEELEERNCQQMEWINEASDSTDSWESEDEDLSFENLKKCNSVTLKSKKLRDDKRRLLKISMAKIRGVEDPETYLRRSVLINNTVRRLQRDAAVNYKCHSLSSSPLFPTGIAFENNHWELDHLNTEVTCKELHAETSVEFEYSSSPISSENENDYPGGIETEIAYNSVNFQLAFASFSADKSIEDYNLEALPSINSSFFSKTSLEEQRMNDYTASSRALKQISPVHVISSQPCGLQFRNPVLNDDGTNEYHESTGSTSILDSVVYHSLIASLET